MLVPGVVMTDGIPAAPGFTALVEAHAADPVIDAVAPVVISAVVAWS